VIATALGWGNAASIAVAVVLAFFFGYSLTLRPLLAGGLSLGKAPRIAFAADTVSITVMEIVDNGFVLLVPEAMASFERRRDYRTGVRPESPKSLAVGDLTGDGSLTISCEESARPSPSCRRSDRRSPFRSITPSRRKDRASFS
jgi:Domain of unknown function (DUF4396)